MVNSTKSIKINWKDVAKERFREITAYLDEKWPPYVSEKFFARTWFAIECIVKNPGRTDLQKEQASEKLFFMGGVSSFIR